MSNLPRGLKTLTVVVRVLSAFGVALVCVLALLWLKPDWLREAVLAGLLGNGAGPLWIDGRARLLGALGALPRTALGLFALWQLWRLFGHYGTGRFFARVTQAYLRRFAWAMLLSALLLPLERGWIGLALTLGNPPGQRTLQLGLAPSDFLAILLSVVVLGVSTVLSEVGRLAEGDAARA
jgi:hypothetical protein